ncbi:hypothetical protein ACIBHY_26780 [Nonomuraea sp. NPDC050547]|uniref:hypothetical protein n=1 Tax=Nonomuraea sp. NPDC050547 TaxID=3364368 RepID=UPI003796B566
MITLLRILAFLPALLLAGCTMSSPTISQDQATTRVEQLIRDTAAALTPTPRLELIPHDADECVHENEPPGKISVSRAYWLRGIPKSANMDIARQVRAYWEAQGHRIVSTGGLDVGHPSIGGESRPDGFILALTWVAGDNLYLASTSTCVWPNGTPEQPAR